MSANRPKIVVVGGTYADTVIKCEQMPQPGQNVTGSALEYTITGPGPGEAIEAALCGCEVHLISKVGGDPFGDMAKAILAHYNVKTDFIFTAEAKNTGSVVTLVNGLGENAVCTYPGANCSLAAQDIEAAESVFSQGNVCLIHGRLPQEAIVAAIRLAKIYGLKVILDPAWPLQLTGDKSNELPLDYFNADILIPNLYEAANITQAEPAPIRSETAKLIGSDLLARGVEAALITMGKRGCVIVDRIGIDYVPAFEVELVDKTGTGDAFAGALAASLAAGDEIRAAVKFASAAGALACTKFGAIESLPSKAEIIELLQKEDTE